jgi:hypothetical protein
MAQAKIPLSIDLNVSGAVVVMPGDILVLTVADKAPDMEQVDDMNRTARRLSDFLGIQVTIIDGISEMAVVKKGDRGDAEQEPEKEPEHDWNMPHRFMGDHPVKCPPNCPVQLAKSNAEPMEGFYNCTHTECNGYRGCRRIAEPFPDPQRLVTSAEFAKMTQKGTYALNDICRRCFRVKGDVQRKPCGDCPDFAETLDLPNTQGLRSLPSREEIEAAVGMPPIIEDNTMTIIEKPPAG